MVKVLSKVPAPHRDLITNKL